MTTKQVFEYVAPSVPSADALASDDPLHGELLTLNMGPQHPATHGVLRLVVTLDGERMPFDAMLLRLRVRARAFDDATLRRFVVRIEAPRHVPEATRAAAQRALDPPARELDVMDLAQGEHF